jgi:hypothetical protein
MTATVTKDPPTYVNRQKPVPPRDAVPGHIETYKLSTHAAERMLERGIGAAEVYAAIFDPDLIVTEADGPVARGCIVFRRGDVEAVVDQGKRLVTSVIDLDERVRPLPRKPIHTYPEPAEPVQVAEPARVELERQPVPPRDPVAYAALEARRIREAARAAEFGPSQALIDWMLSPHTEKVGPWGTMDARYVFITPELAELILDDHNLKNRPGSQVWSEHWRRIMERDEFRLTHQGIAFDVKSILADGQNRLRGIVDTGIGQWLQVTVGCPVETYSRIDGGKSRTAGDTLAVRGVPHHTLAGGVCRMVYLFDLPGGFTVRHRVTADNIDEVAERDMPLLLAAMEWGLSAKAGFPAMVSTASTTMAYLILRAHPAFGIIDDPDLKDEDAPPTWRFLRGVSTGLNLLDPDDARLLLRRIIQPPAAMSRPDNIAQLGTGLNAWNRWASGSPDISLTWRKNSRVPPVFLLPGGGGPRPVVEREENRPRFLRARPSKPKPTDHRLAEVYAECHGKPGDMAEKLRAPVTQVYVWLADARRRKVLPAYQPPPKKASTVA